ncbi:MAG: hypothetical protein AAGL10_06710 [Pseudomonadota bacterium]
MKRITLAIVAAVFAIVAAPMLLPGSGKARAGLEEFDGPPSQLSSEPVLVELFTSQGCS